MIVSNFCGFLLELNAICMPVIRHNNAESLKAYCLLSCGNWKPQFSMSSLCGIASKRGKKRSSTSPVVL